MTQRPRIHRVGSQAIRFREEALTGLTVQIGVYALYDLDDIAIYVGQTTSVGERGIRGRVQRHLTSARSDMIANRQLDVWEIALVRAWPEPDVAKINSLESALFHRFDAVSTLMNGQIPPLPPADFEPPAPSECVQLIDDNELALRRTPSIRLPRQAEHYGQLVAHYLTVKDSPKMVRSMRAHFERLARYHQELTNQAGPELIGRET